MVSLKEKAAALLQTCDVVVLASIHPEGCPRPVPMAKVKADGISTIWMATGQDAVKTRDFLLNPKAGICFYEKGNSVALTGEVEVVTDGTTKKELWQDWFIAHFPQGPADPNYVLLKFQSCQGTYWIDGEFLHEDFE